MSVLSELQKAIEEIPEAVFAMLREPPPDANEQAEAEGYAFSWQEVIGDLREEIKGLDEGQQLDFREMVWDKIGSFATDWQSEMLDVIRANQQVEEAEPFREGIDVPPEIREAPFDPASALQPVAPEEASEATEPLESLARQPPLDVGSELADLSRDPHPSRLGLPTPQAPDDLSEIAGSLHSAELDALEGPSGSVLDLLTRIAEGIEKLVERTQEEMGQSFHPDRGGAVTDRQDIGWSSEAFSPGQEVEHWSALGSLPPIQRIQIPEEKPEKE